MSQSEHVDFCTCDKYISAHAVPKEPINAWIKWKEGIEFDYLVFSFPKDAFINRLWNVHEDVYRDQIDKNGYQNQRDSDAFYLIDKKYLEIDGFFGFKSYFTSIPESDKKVNFKVDFVKNSQVIRQVDLDTTIIVPNIRVKPDSDSDLNLFITEDSGEIKLNLIVQKLGSAIVQDFGVSIDKVRKSEGLGVNIKIEGPKEPAYTTASLPSLIKLTGSGDAMYRIAFHCKDLLGNPYKSNDLHLSIMKEGVSPRDIPIQSKLEVNDPMIVAH